MFHYFRGRGDGVSCKKIYPGIDGAFHTGLVSLDKPDIIIVFHFPLPDLL